MGRTGKKYRFYEISGLKLVTTPIMEREIYAVIAEIKGGGEFKIAGGLDSEILEKIILLINPRIARRISEIPAGIEEKTKNRTIFDRFFIGLFFLILGVIWSVAGFIFLRDYVYRGLLFWPFGIWLASFGLFEIAGLPLYKWMKTGPAWLKITLAAVWLGSYILICRC
jgi:ABC-type antimicrobial peptide transport system permease subunit